MRQITWAFLAVFVGGLFATAVTAEAQVVMFLPPNVTISAGYSNLQTQRASNLFYDHSGGYLDADFAWRLPLVVPLQAGFGLSGSGYSERESSSFPVNDNSYYSDYHLYSDVGLAEIEPRLGLRLGGETGFFAIPRIGAGLLVDSYSIDQSSTINGTVYLSTRYHDGAAFEIRPDIVAGYSWGPVAVALDASYLYAWGDFGGLGHYAQEFRIGAFLSFRF